MPIRLSIVLGLVLTAPGGLGAQDLPRYRMETIAGGDRTELPDGLPARSYRFEGLADVTVGADGAIYIVETRAKLVRRIDSNGILTTVVRPDPRPCMVCSLVSPTHLATDAKGNVFISDGQAGAVRSLARDGTVTTIVKQTLPFQRRRLGRESPIDARSLGIAVTAGLATGSSGGLYIVDSYRDIVWRIVAGTATIVAGTGSPAQGQKRRRRLAGRALDTPLDASDVAVDRAGTVYIYERTGSLLRVDARGDITQAAPPATYGPSVRPSSYHVDVDARDDVLFADGVSIRRLSKQGKVCTVAIAGRRPVASPWCGAPLVIDGDYTLGGFATTPSGALLFVDKVSECLYRIEPDGQVTVVAGRDPRQREFAVAEAEFLELSTLALRRDGALLIGDRDRVSVLAGSKLTQIETRSGDRSELNGDGGLASLPDGSFVFTDASNFLVFRRWPDGRLTTVDGVRPRTAPQPWLSAAGMASSADGTLFVAEARAHQVVRVSPPGVASIVAGTGQSGYTGDDGPAARAQLDTPSAVAVDAKGQVYIADRYNHVIRKMDVDGTITTLASGLSYPRAVLAHPSGVIIAADTGNDRIVAIEPDGTLYTIAGSQQSGSGQGDGDARNAKLHAPCALDLAPDGTIYFADCGTGTVRKLVPF